MAVEEPVPLRLSFAQVDVEGLELELPIPAGHRVPPRVTLRSAQRLSGRIVQRPGQLRIDRLEAEQIALDALRMIFGTVVLAEEGKAVLEGVKCTFERREAVELDLEAAMVRAHRLSVEVSGTSVAARASFRDLRVAVQGDEGSFEAEDLLLENFVIVARGLRVESPRVEATRLRVEWGAAGFRLEAHGARAPSLKVRADAFELELEAIAIAHLVSHEAHVLLEGAEVGKVTLDARFEPHDSASATVELVPKAAPVAHPRFDGRLLDALFGELKVDLRVDLEVPILGRRVATHRFRVPVEAGAVNFLQLEDDLSTLENAILNFSVRDHALVLERGIPLLQTRGNGKAIVVWVLDDVDHALARDRDRVRLAVLPDFDLAKDADSDGTEPKSKPKIAIRALNAENIELSLRLEPSEIVRQGVLPSMAVGSLSVHGEVHPLTREGSREGRLQLEAREISATVRTLLDDHPVELVELRCAAIPEAELTFVGSHIERVQITLEKLGLKSAERLPVPAVLDRRASDPT